MKSTFLYFSILASTAAVALAAPRDARAQGNDLSAPTGGRTALMGGAGVALSQDGAAPFLNPATIVRIRDQRLAFSVNFYSLGLTHFSSFHAPGPVDGTHFGNGDISGSTGITTNSFRVLPSTLCLFFTVGDLQRLVDSKTVEKEERVPRKKLAICFASLESEDESLQAISFHGQSAAGLTSQVESFSRSWSRTFVGPTYSTYITRNLAVGASIQAVYTHDAYGLDANALGAKLGGGSLTSSLGTSGAGFSLAATALVGATYRRGDTTFGASFRPPSLHLFSNFNATFNQSNDASGTTDATIVSGTGSLHADPPMRIAAGLGVEKPKLRFEFDAALDVPTANALTAIMDTTTVKSGTTVSQTAGHETDAISQHLAFNPSAGLEYFLRPDFSLLGGISANFSALSPLANEPSLGNLVQAKRTDVALSFGIGSYGNGTELLFGTQVDAGFGQALAANPYVIPNDWSVIGRQTYSAMLIVAGATDLRTIGRAVNSVENAVTTGDPDKKKK